ncbi:MAG: TrkA family potassium uptake protein [Clostridiales bacterium]|nr:TrkA family potassium uptake protein [Clostridiales bacterium]
MKSFAVLGLGRFGTAVACQLFRMGYEVLAVDNSMERVNAVADMVTQAVGGDIKEEATLRALGIKNMDCVVIGVSDLNTSVLATLYLKEMGVKKVVCKASDKNQRKVLQKIGADSVIIPEYEMGVKTAIGLVSHHLMDYIDLSDEYGIIDIAVPKSWVGKTIAQLDIRKSYEINIIAVKNSLDPNEVNVSPGSSYEFKQNDIVVFVGKTQTLNKLERA